ncbi:MAG: hypothetical protein ABI841_08395 [Chloroflexota bacterium]
MGQVNVNTPGGGTAGEPAGSSGAGMILGIIVAVLVIAALVYFLVIAPQGNNGADGDGGDTPATDDGGEVLPSGWRLVDLA